METPEGTMIVDSDGVRGRIKSTPPSDDKTERVAVGLEDGQEVLVPVEALQSKGDKGYHLPFSFRQLSREATIPVLEERLKVENRPTEGGVRIDKRVHEREVVVDLPASHEEIEIERVPVNREVSRPVEPHYEGKTYVVPLHEEVLVTQKQLLLREELRITKRRVQKTESRRVTLREEEVSDHPLGGNG